jgi:hypothetical protein
MINHHSRYRAPPAHKRAAARPEPNGFSNDRY